jgi:hypothetical protein
MEHSYLPIDLTSIRVAKISNDRDLESEIVKICEILKDICKFTDLYRF